MQIFEHEQHGRDLTLAAQPIEECLPHLLLGRLVQAQWGRSSEKISSAQLVLGLGEPQPPQLPEPAQSAPDCAEVPAEPERPMAPSPKNRKKTRQIPAHIPRITTLSEPPDAQKICTDCRKQKALIGSQTSEVLEWEPGRFRVEATERRKYACRCCQSGL